MRSPAGEKASAGPSERTMLRAVLASEHLPIEKHLNHMDVQKTGLPTPAFWDHMENSRTNWSWRLAGSGFSFLTKILER